MPADDLSRAARFHPKESDRRVGGESRFGAGGDKQDQEGEPRHARQEHGNGEGGQSMTIFTSNLGLRLS